MHFSGFSAGSSFRIGCLSKLSGWANGDEEEDGENGESNIKVIRRAVRRGNQPLPFEMSQLAVKIDEQIRIIIFLNV